MSQASYSKEFDFTVQALSHPVGLQKFLTDENEMTVIYHMADKDSWNRAVKEGAYGGTENDLKDGFIHFSTKETVVESAAKHRAGVTNLVLLAVEADDLGEALVWEPARAGVLFPHLYGALDPSKAISVIELPLGADNLHVFPDLA
ncbi:DUF952 domain-containing protein [Sneathiella marina]|uniref:DUF952 domain-containing protein n=1 Tax=Sneathiella marina TaxID=2950108 RepID=A0ABY4W1C9_9PROT|nr:DUF952 domain-containing protein [Sneathiella marina]USG60772.1 DUF952 domain-containing protein [Sneathiella marina]